MGITNYGNEIRFNCFFQSETVFQYRILFLGSKGLGSSFYKGVFFTTITVEYLKSSAGINREKN